MANVRAIYSVGDSLVSYLTNAFQLEDPLGEGETCSFSLLSSHEMAGEASGGDPAPPAVNTVSLYLYRATVNEHLRNHPPVNGPPGALPPLPLDLHYLVTVWATTVAEEHQLLAWVMHKLHQHQVLGASELKADAGFGPGDVIHVIPAELSTEDLMRIWEAIRRPYSLSASYIARVICIDAGAGPEAVGKPVLVRRFELDEKPRGGAG